MLRKRTAKLSFSLEDEPFFRTLSGRTIESLRDYVYQREYDARQIIFFPDDPCDSVFWVRSGRVKVSRVSGDGRELSLRHVFPGDMLGEHCLGGQSRRETYAEAMVPSMLLIMRAEDFERAVDTNNELAAHMTGYLCNRLHETEQVLAEIVFKTVRTRVASALFRLYDREENTDGDNIRITHQEIANLIGSTRETTTTVLHELREEGILEIANRRIRITNAVALEHLARSI